MQFKSKWSAGALVAAGCVVLEFAFPVASDAYAAATPLTRAASARPAVTSVVGRSVSAIVYNDVSTSDVYLGNPTFDTTPRLLLRNARATSVAGNLVEYTRGGHRYWLDLGDSSEHGTVPATWKFPAPDGGLRVTKQFGRPVLQYTHVNGESRTYPLPSDLPTRQVHYSVVATLDGTVLTASAPHAYPQAETLSSFGSFRSIPTTGLPRGAALTCTSLSGGAVGCMSGHRVVRLDATGRMSPQVTRLSAAPTSVAVTGGYTSWTTALGHGGACPCTLASVDLPGEAQSIISGLTSSALVSGSGRFYYSEGTTPSKAGVYVDLFAGSTERRVAAAGRRPLRALRPILGAGRAVWVDDSAAGWTVWTEPVMPGPHTGMRHKAAARTGRGALAVSGDRLVYAARNGTLMLQTRSRTTTLGRAHLVTLSGTRLLLRTADGHLVLRNLATGARTDETRRHGARQAWLSGRYLSYLRSSGWIVRLDTTRMHARPVRVAQVKHPGTSAYVYSWGNWTAWSVRVGHTWRSGWRNSVAGGPIHHLDSAGRRVYAATAGGPVVGSSARTGFALLGWRTGARLSTLPGSGSAPAVDAGTVAWLRGRRPTVAAIGVHVRNQPHALGFPIAARTTQRHRVWQLDLPTSATLGHCVVTLRHGSMQRHLACVASSARRGEVFVRWKTGTAARGRWRWTVTASNLSGALLGTNCGRHTFRGTVRVR